MESLYLLTGPLTAAAGLLLVVAGLCVGSVGLLASDGSRLADGGLALARWSADLERWRIATVRSPAGRAESARERPSTTAGRPARPGLWPDVAHASRCSPSCWSPLWSQGCGGSSALSHEGYPQLSAIGRASFDPTHDSVFTGLLLGQLLAGVLGAVTLAVGEILAFAAFLAGQAVLQAPAPRAAFGQPGCCARW